MSVNLNKQQKIQSIAQIVSFLENVRVSTHLNAPPPIPGNFITEGVLNGFWGATGGLNVPHELSELWNKAQENYLQSPPGGGEGEGEDITNAEVEEQFGGGD